MARLGLGSTVVVADLIDGVEAGSGQRRLRHVGSHHGEQLPPQLRAYGNDNWEFDENGLMRQRPASINDLPIKESDRKFHWDGASPG